MNGQQTASVALRQTVPNFSGAVWDCATACALARKKKIGFKNKCRNEFMSMACNDCRVYIGRYINVDSNQMDLFMMQAENRALDVRAQHHRASGSWLLVGLFCLIFFMLGKSIYDYWKGATGGAPKTAATVKTTPAVAKATDQVRTDKGRATHEKIMATLQKVSAEIEKRESEGRDVYWDRQINCTDYALLFYKFYPDKEDVCIEWNYNPDPKIDMNHAFNCVYIDGVWRAIEPQYNASKDVKKSYFMKDYWSSSVYDSSLNEDSTEFWKKQMYWGWEQW